MISTCTRSRFLTHSSCAGGPRRLEIVRSFRSEPQGHSRPEGSMKGSIPTARWGSRKSVGNRKSRFAGLLQSPIPDSNRRPPPYHAIQTATGGSQWQRFGGSSSHFPGLGEPNLCHPLRPSVPQLFHPNRPKTGSLDLEPPPGNQRLTFCIEKGSLRSSNAGARVRCIIWWKPMTLKAGEIEVVGRDEELASVHDFLDAVDRLPAALVIEGEAGIGKTTLWRAGIAFAEELGYRVLSTRPAQAESQVSYAGLADLLEPVLGEALAELPPPQGRALEAALLLRDAGGSVPDQTAIAFAFLGALRAAVGEKPALVAVDDLQWLDAPSAFALRFAAR